MRLNVKIGVSVVIGMCLALSRPAYASTHSADSQSRINPSHLSVEPVWQARSEATATWMWLDIYKATLFTQNGFDHRKLLDDAQPLKLKLCYLRSIDKADLIKGAEAVLAPELAPDLKQAVDALHQAYQNVTTGDCYALKFQPGKGTQLWLNDQLTFKTDLPGFKAVYFGIWLGQNPLSDSLKTQLLAPFERKESSVL